jgi:hypothetical protein
MGRCQGFFCGAEIAASIDDAHAAAPEATLGNRR